MDEELKNQFEDRLRFEALMAHPATSFEGLPAEQVDGAIENSQQRIVETLGLDRSSLFQINLAGEWHLTHCWVRPGMERYPEGIPINDNFPWSLSRTLQGRIVRMSSHNDLPVDA